MCMGLKPAGQPSFIRVGVHTHPLLSPPEGQGGIVQFRWPHHCFHTFSPPALLMNGDLLATPPSGCPRRASPPEFSMNCRALLVFGRAPGPSQSAAPVRPPVDVTALRLLFDLWLSCHAVRMYPLVALVYVKHARAWGPGTSRFQPRAESGGILGGVLREDPPVEFSGGSCRGSYGEIFRWSLQPQPDSAPG